MKGYILGLTALNTLYTAINFYAISEVNDNVQQLIKNDGNYKLKDIQSSIDETLRILNNIKKY